MDENIMRVVNPRHYLKLDMGGFRICRINWVSTLAASALLWSMIGWCIDKENSSLEALLNGQAWVTQNFTWLYIGTQDVWTVFLIYLVFSKARVLVKRARAPASASDYVLTAAFRTPPLLRAAIARAERAVRRHQARQG